MKNLIVMPAYHYGTSLSEMLESIELLINKYKFDIKVIGKDLLFEDASKINLFDTADEVLAYNKIIQELITIKDDCRILFLDFFFPGIDIIKYNSEVTGTKLKLGSFMLGATFLPGDLYRWEWLSYFENAWLNLNDLLYVPSNYFKNFIPEKFKSKVRIHPWGLDSFIKRVPNTPTNKEYDVVFPHRLSEDKGIDDFISLVKSLPNTKFLVTSYRDLQDNEYYKKLKTLKNVDFRIGDTSEMHLNTLSKCRIVFSSAKQETFGYSVIKALLCGCIPVLPNDQVYPELFKGDFLYNTIEDATKDILKILSDENYLKNINQKIDKYIIEFVKFSFLPILVDFFELKS